MLKGTRPLALAAMLAAAEFVLLLLGSVIPSGRLALAAIAGTANFITYIECGRRNTLLVYAAVSLLGLILPPLKAPAVLYFAFFGYYPLVKSVIERLGKPRLEWPLKLLLVLAALTAVWLVYSAGFLRGAVPPAYAPWLLYAGCAVAFVIYDTLLSRLVEVYVGRKIKK